MALIVEDGTGIATANSYIDSSYADAYFLDRDIAEWASLTNKDALLIKATDYIETVYYGKWQGERLTTTQALEFPRVIDSVDVGVPDRLKKACCELALKANSGELITDIEQRVIKKKVAVIETTYAEYSDQTTQYTKVYDLLSEYLLNSNSNTVKVTRS